MTVRLPGMPTVGNRTAVRIPDFPAHMVGAAVPVVAPPLPQQPTVLGIASDYEAQTVSVDWPRTKEASVYLTSRRWRACDVFVELPSSLTQSFVLSLFVYAVAQGARTLVASGRLSFNPSLPNASTELRHWLVAARTVAERYEVTARVSQSSIAPNLTGKLTVTIAAADEMTEPQPGVGTFTKVGSPNGVKFAAVQLSAPPKLEVVAVQGVNDVAAARYLMLLDDTSTSFAGLNGSTPIMVWPLGATAGQGVFDRISYRCQLAPALGISSTAGVFTAAADGAATITVR